VPHQATFASSGGGLSGLTGQGTLVSGGSCAGGPGELTLDGFEPAGEVGKRAGILVG
jgi:hypothetical protein